MSSGRILIEKAKDVILMNEAYSDNVVRELLLLYDEAAFKAEGNISALATRFADANSLTPDVAKQMLEGEELSGWRMGIDKYLEKIDATGKGTKLEIELNLLSAKSQINREEQLLGEIYKNIADMANLSDDLLGKALAETYRINYKAGMFNVQSSSKIGFNIAKIDEKALIELLRFPWQTRTFSENLWGKCDVIANHLRREITLGFMQGSSVKEMAKNINDVMDKGRYAAERLVRTECKYFANQGELAGYKANGIEKYRFVGGTESSHSCDCDKMNGQEILVEDADAGVNYPPMHPNCLCIVVAVFKLSMFDDYSDVVPLKDNVNLAEWTANFAV